MIVVTRVAGADAGLGLGRPWFAAVARAALEHLGAAAESLDAPCAGPVDGAVVSEISGDADEVLLDIQLVDDATIAALNESHLNCAGPTNVLGFEAATDAPGLGQIALSLDTARREALLYGQDVQAHSARLLVHAVLHLAGLEHGQIMEDETERILAQMSGALLPSPPA